MISARREAQLKDVADAIREAGGEVLPVVTDISKKGDADKLVAKTVEVYGKVDILSGLAITVDRGGYADNLSFVVQQRTAGGTGGNRRGELDISGVFILFG